MRDTLDFEKTLQVARILPGPFGQENRLEDKAGQ
jgi:hypothetical protein